MIPNYKLSDFDKAKSDLDAILTEMRHSAEQYKLKGGKDWEVYVDRIDRLTGVFSLTIVVGHLLKDTKELIGTIESNYLDAEGNLLPEKEKVTLMSFMPKISTKLKYLIKNL